MTDQLISIEVFNLAREKGLIWNVLTEYTKRPTQSLLQKWLREIHKIDVRVFRDFQFLIKNKNISSEYYDIVVFKSYEEALEAGLKKALNIL